MPEHPPAGSVIPDPVQLQSRLAMSGPGGFRVSAWGLEAVAYAARAFALWGLVWLIGAVPLIVWVTPVGYVALCLGFLAFVISIVATPIAQLIREHNDRSWDNRTLRAMTPAEHVDLRIAELSIPVGRSPEYPKRVVDLSAIENQMIQRIEARIEARIEESVVQALKTKINAAEDKIKAAEDKVKAAEDKVKAAEDKVKAAEDKVKAAEDKLKAAEMVLPGNG